MVVKYLGFKLQSLHALKSIVIVLGHSGIPVLVLATVMIIQEESLNYKSCAMVQLHVHLLSFEKLQCY